MPLKIPNDLPTGNDLADEGIFIMPAERALHQDIRPLRIAMLNLMPTKVVTELQLLRLLGNSPLQIDITLIRMGSHESRNTSAEHLQQFYEPLDQVLHEKFDGLIITGAPVETLDFEQVDYWDELCRLMEWSKTNVWSTMHVCWGAQAGLYHHYGIGKYPLQNKMSGIFTHRVLAPREHLLRGFDEYFLAPHSRHTEIRREDILAHPDLILLADSEEAGAFLAVSRDGRRVFVTGHPEYDRLTLKGEYDRDLSKGMNIVMPKHYFPDDDPSREPPMTWRSHAHLLYSNWLNYYVYQETPFDLEAMPATTIPAGG